MSNDMIIYVIELQSRATVVEQGSEVQYHSSFNLFQVSSFRFKVMGVGEFEDWLKGVEKSVKV